MAATETDHTWNAIRKNWPILVIVAKWQVHVERDIKEIRAGCK